MRAVELRPGDCLDVLASMPENSIDSCVTDPPYGLAFMGRGWDRGVPGAEYWRAVLRVLKPGAHLLAFGGTRTYHRMTCAIEDAGFEIRDCIQWIYGQGFPKSYDTAQGIEKLLTTGKARRPDRDLGGLPRDRFSGDVEGGLIANTGGKTPLTTDAARQWEGWGTALKPACEPIVLARKPLSEATVAANVLRWRTGALAIDRCRIGTTKDVPASAAKDRIGQIAKGDERGRTMETDGFNPNIGRWPANVILSFPEDEYQIRGDVTPEQRSELYRWLSENP